MSGREDQLANEAVQLGPEARRQRPGGWRLEHTYSELPQLFYSRVAPTPVRDPQLVVFNVALAERLGLDAEALNSPIGASIFAGNTLPEGAQPIAQAYAGHQFGHFTGLGDGRAILLGEQVIPNVVEGPGSPGLSERQRVEGSRAERFDIQLKGSGRTPYSRSGDGRAALGPMLREYIISEAMHALGIRTTRSLAVVTTGEPVYRETVLPGAILTRVAASHIRVGTMEWAAAHRDHDGLRALSHYTARRHYPELLEGSERPGFRPGEIHFALFTAIVERQARLIAQWQSVGFIHGVMNTDNMALSGETIDYGPCAFMDAYDPATVFSSIDQGGRYAYGNQPAIAQWNLARLAEAMLPLFDDDQDRAVARATEALHRFEEIFTQSLTAGMRAKLGLFDEHADDAALINDLFAWMQATSADFTNTFRMITDAADSAPAGVRPPDVPRGRALARPTADAEFDAWHQRLRSRWQQQPQSSEEVRALMRRTNPAFIPRNHKVEEALAAATAGDLSVMQRLLDVVAHPFDQDRDAPEYAKPAPGAVPYRTFCGT